MSVRSSHSIALLVVLAGLAGCSGGGSQIGSATFSCLGSQPRAMCLQNCSLGCSTTGCSRTDIAQNETIILQFSANIDPRTVGPSSIRFRTAAGDPPVGEYLVNGNQVEFVPSLQVSGAQTYYGFASGETYTMTIIGGETEPSVVRSTGGLAFEKTLTCTLQSTRGIVDYNGVPPRAQMVVPTAAQIGAAPLATEIVLEFNELIDVTPFSTGTGGPVNFGVRQTRLAQAGGYECDPGATMQPLSGSTRLDFDAATGKTILTFRPNQQLPGNVCVEVDVTNGVTDLSGRPAQPQTFTFLTVQVAQVERPVTEEFDTTDQLDVDASGATWNGGVVVFAPIGGDGRHGAFSTSLCVDTQTTVEGKRVYTLNCDSTIIPATNTTTGSAIAVTDGKFFFSTMVVPADARIVFTGTNPPVISVAGRCDIQGDLSVAGENVATYTYVQGGQAQAVAGQAGGLGGGNGGNGGSGGDKITNFIAGAQTVNQGRRGQDARLLAGHAYLTSVQGTGGAGSVVQPASGNKVDMQFGAGVTSTSFTWPCLSASAGGAGGGLMVPGLPARVTPDALTGLGFVGHIWNNHLDLVSASVPRLDVMGPIATPGTALTLFPFPAGSGFSRSSQHFLVGGSGGGGSASSPCMSIFLDNSRAYAPGLGGGGGGGALALRAGGSLRVAPTGRLLARGGNAANNIATAGTTVPQPSPAGGGSGGSVVLQSGGSVDISGLVDVRGGLGGQFDRTASTATLPGGARIKIAGGNGSPGYGRLETTTAPTLGQFASLQPAATAQNLGVLTESDDLAVCRSKFYATNELFGPNYARYEIYATVDGLPVVYSDDPAVSNLPAQVGAPIRALFQCAALDPVTKLPVTFGPWRTAVRTTASQTGIATDALNGFRFILLIDRAVSTNVVIQKIVVVYRV